MESSTPQGPASPAARRAAVIEALIPTAPSDVAPLRIAFTKVVSKQWDFYVPAVIPAAPSGKARFIAKMYARACYSMLLVNSHGPAPLRASPLVPLPRGLALTLGSGLLAGLDWFVPPALHRQLLLMSALMGILDVVLDECASAGEAAVLRIASLVTRQPPSSLLPVEQPVAALAQSLRRDEDPWQSRYWAAVLEPAVRDYCLAEALAVVRAPDPTGTGHRWAGIVAVIKGMWYVVGPRMGLRGEPSSFQQSAWTREQRWMADTTMLMQMIDDWVDQDEDRAIRLTPVVSGVWNTQSVAALYRKTVGDLTFLLHENHIRNRVLQQLFLDLYNDYLHLALQGMRSGDAA